MKKIKPCSEIWLHNFPNLKWDTKCKDCGKTVDEITGIRKDLVVFDYIEILKKKLKSDYYNKDRIIQLMEEARREMKK